MGVRGARPCDRNLSSFFTFQHSAVDSANDRVHLPRRAHTMIQKPLALRPHFRVSAVSLLVINMVTLANAGTVSHWTQNNAADFNPGTFHNVVATSLGDLKLSKAVKDLALKDDRVSAVYAMAQTKDGTIYAGTGPQGVLLKISNGKVETAATFDDGSSIFSLAVDSKNRLLIGTGGHQGSCVSH